jgi:large subunit ribosomal protein L25
MAKQVKLKAEPRANVGRSAVRKLKARGIIPAVIYGGKDKPQPLQVAARDINAMMSHASGENVLVELEIAGEKSNRAALVQEVQHSPVGGDIVHIDFHAISMDEILSSRSAPPRALRLSADCLSRACGRSPSNVCRAICQIVLL